MTELNILESLYADLVNNVETKNRQYHLQTFKKCFIGSEAVDYMVKTGLAATREKAVEFGNMLAAEGLLSHVTKDHKFEDGPFFYRFAAFEEPRGKKGSENWTPKSSADSQGSSKDLHLAFSKATDRGPLDSFVETDFVEREMDLEVSPLDEYNVKLLNMVKPKSWENPTGVKKFTLLVIGAGAGGLISCIQGAGLGLKTALIEKHLLGGDCLSVGCVPSKAVLRAAKSVKEVRHANHFGINITGEVTIDFGAIMQRMRKLRSDISPADSAERYTSLGAHVFQGSAKFIDKTSVEVFNPNDPKPETQRIVLQFSKCIIATGGRAFVPPISGLHDIRYLTNASVFNLTKLPKRFGVIGSGPIGTELAQAFANFGSEVFVFDAQDKILPREDQDAAKLVQTALEHDGVKFILSAEIIRIYYATKKVAVQNSDKVIETQEIVVYFRQNNVEKEVILDELLVSAGRKPNVENLDLEKAGVEFTSRGITVKDGLQTTNSNVYAVGDVCLKYQFTHMADASAKVAFRNAMFPFTNEKISKLVVPWCTYTSPEIAHVGAYEADLRRQNIEFQTFQVSFEHNDRAILDSTPESLESPGFVKILVKKGTDQILGCTIVSDHAGEMITTMTLAIKAGIGARDLSGVIVPYPTLSEGLKRVCGEVNKQRLSPGTKRLLRTLVGLKKLGS